MSRYVCSWLTINKVVLIDVVYRKLERKRSGTAGLPRCATVRSQSGWSVGDQPKRRLEAKGSLIWEIPQVFIVKTWCQLGLLVKRKTTSVFNGNKSTALILVADTLRFCNLGNSGIHFSLRRLLSASPEFKLIRQDGFVGECLWDGKEIATISLFGCPKSSVNGIYLLSLSRESR